MTVGKAGSIRRNEVGVVPRPYWQLRPLEGVGPLTFGMTFEEVTGVLGEPRREERHGRDRVTKATFPNGLTVFFGFDVDAGLSCVKFDAFRGPELVYNDVSLTGQVPSELTALLLEWAEQNNWLVRYCPRSGEPAEYEELGLYLIVQRDGDRLVSRPLTYGQPWIDDEMFAHNPYGTTQLLGMNEW